MSSLPIHLSQFIDVNGDGKVNGIDYQNADNIQIKLLRAFGILETTGDISESYLQLVYNQPDNK